MTHLRRRSLYWPALWARSICRSESKNAEVASRIRGKPCGWQEHAVSTVLRVARRVREQGSQESRTRRSCAIASRSNAFSSTCFSTAFEEPPEETHSGCSMPPTIRMRWRPIGKVLSGILQVLLFSAAVCLLQANHLTHRSPSPLEHRRFSRVRCVSWLGSVPFFPRTLAKGADRSPGRLGLLPRRISCVDSEKHDVLYVLGLTSRTPV